MTRSYHPDAKDSDADGIIQPDWRDLYLAEKHRADTLAALLKRRHALDPVEIATVINDLTNQTDTTSGSGTAKIHLDEGPTQ